MRTLTLQSEAITAEFTMQNGALVRLRSNATGWEVVRKPELGLSFRMLLPLSDRRNNPVDGNFQDKPLVDPSRDERGVTFTWTRLRSQFGGEHDIRFALTARLSDAGLVFQCTIANNSDLVVENVYAPYLGGLQRPQDTPWFKAFSYVYASAQEWDLWPRFSNLKGYYGVDFPTQVAGWTGASGTPASPYILLRSPDEGLYVGADEITDQYVGWFTELRPGYGTSMDSRVPSQDSIDGTDVDIRFAAVHVPYVMPKESRALTPVRVEPFSGSWNRGVDCYRRTRGRKIRLPESPAWIREPHAWQQVHINSPEDELRVPFRELVGIGEECARHGVTAIQLVGWNEGGQDQGNPSHRPDPRLGTEDELRAAIRGIQELGVKVVLFTKFVWADRATRRFREELIRQAIKDPYGDYYLYPGYQYQTATQLLDVNTKRLIPMCFLSEEYLRVCGDEFQRVVDLGADGMLFDECLHHSPALFCFDTSHGHRYGASVYANDNELIRRFREQADPVRPDFLYAGEACYDLQFGVYQLSYHRSDSSRHLPVMRYMLPDVPLMTAVTGFDDRNMVNQCLLYRYIISYEPYNFKGRLRDFPRTVAYGGKMDALRREYRAYLWDGEFCYHDGAGVLADGEPHEPYAVFRRRSDGARAVVVANYSLETPKTVTVTGSDAGRLERYRLVEDDGVRTARGEIEVPPASACVVFEKE